MARWAKFLTGFWRDPEVGGLSPEARLLYVWCFTNESCRVSGLYLVSPETAGSETRLENRGPAAWKELLAYRKSDGQPLVEYSPSSGVLWVRGKFKIETRTRSVNRKPSAKIILAALRELHELPSNPLEARFRKKYAKLLKGYPRDRVSPRDQPRRSSSSSTKPIPNTKTGGVASMVGSSQPAHSTDPGARPPADGSRKPGRGGKRKASEIDSSEQGRAECQHRKVELYTRIYEDLGRHTGEKLLHALESARIVGVYQDTRRPVFEAERYVRDTIKAGLIEHYGPRFAAQVVVQVKPKE